MERAIRLKLFDLNNDEQRQLTYNYFDFIWHLIVSCQDNKVIEVINIILANKAPESILW